MRYLLAWSGMASVVGGALWIGATLLHASKPRGRVGGECAYRAMRQSGPIDAALVLFSLLLLTAGVSGLVKLARSTGRFGRLGNTGAALAGAGAAVLVVSAVVQAAFFDDDFPLMPYVVVPGALALISGILLLAVGILRSKVLPRWTVALLIVGTLAMLGFNEQTAAALLAVPLGVAWMAVGLVL